MKGQDLYKRTRLSFMRIMAACITLCAAAAQAAAPHKNIALQPFGVYDTTGKFVGRHFAHPAGVVMDLNDTQTFVSLINPGNLTGVALSDYDKTDLMELGQLFFATNDCTGPAYVSPELMTAYGMKRGVMVTTATKRRYVYRIVLADPLSSQ